MELIADGLLLLAAIVAALYCYVLSRRLQRLSGLEGGLGQAITGLSERVDQMSGALDLAKRSTEAASTELSLRIAEAEKTASALKALVESASAAQAALTRLDDAARTGEKSSAGARKASDVGPEAVEPAAAVAPEGDKEADPAPKAKARTARKPSARTAAHSGDGAAKPIRRARKPRVKPAPDATDDLAATIGAILSKGQKADEAAIVQSLIAALGQRKAAANGDAT